MTLFSRYYSRRRFLQASLAVGATAALGGFVAACSNAVAPSGQAAGAAKTFNWLTWSDHFYQQQLDAIKSSTGITPAISELMDNASGMAKLKQVHGQLDMISGDAKWVPAYYAAGLVEAWDINELAVSKQLYSVARELTMWTVPAGYLGYPFGWSPIVIAYNPTYVTPAPDSWQVLVDPKYKGRVVMENNPTEIVAQMAKATGAVDPYNPTDQELAKAKDMLVALKPNVLKFAEQVTDAISALASGEAWLTTTNIGAQDRVHDAGGPLILEVAPKEGTVGWMDAEMIVKGGANTGAVKPFLEAAEQAVYVAENFFKNGRPLFNEQAYQIIKDMGQQDRADRYLYNKPETVNTMTLRGPSGATDSMIKTFNDVFS
jgi:putative spermidine/putrescine transport system substrate-binding protein/spermidine/putrescine transport system substrate-binding protein